MRLGWTWIAACVAATWMSVSLPAAAADVASLESPGHVLSVTLSVDGDGRLDYRVDRLGDEVIAPSRLGLLLGNARALSRYLQFENAERREEDVTWEQPWGERRLVRDRYTEMTAHFVQKRSGVRVDVVFRLYDDGLGFRYAIPAQEGLDHVEIEDELTEFTIAEPASAWWIPAGEWNRYEYLYQRTPLNQVGRAHTPLTLRTDAGLHVAIHEAALVDYPGMWLTRPEGQRLRAQLAPGGAKRSLPMTTPWRSVQISDDAAGLVDSNLILNLNEPNRLGDVSWFKPGKYAGVWWSLHLQTESWAAGDQHGATTANTQRYIDFAADNGLIGVLVEGWNRGWDGDWFGWGREFEFASASEDFDLDTLSDYAKKKGVQLILHHETGCAVSRYERQLSDAMTLAEKHGVHAIKTGYVCDSGQIQRQDVEGGPISREWHDGQWMSNHFLRVLQEAAKHRIAINSHEPIKDTGLRRTWPNWISREGARGMEYNAWGNPKNPPSHEVNLVYTRLLSGPMDYTPGVVSLKGRGDTPIPSTLARQLALYVVIYSPIQMLADLPEHYAEHPEVMPFLRAVPTDWESSQLVAGEVGEYAVMARRDRNSSAWYVGAITDEHGRQIDLPLSFLDPKRKYRAEIYRDGDDADFRSNPFAFASETRTVTAADRLQLRIAPGGGEAIRFVPLR